MAIGGRKGSVGACRDDKAERERSATETGQAIRDAQFGEPVGAAFRLVPERVRARPAPVGYPSMWPAVSWMVRAQAGFRCEHCGNRFPPGGLGEEALGVHHLDGDRFNLWDWNLVPLCLVDHGLVEREVHVDREQLAMFGAAFPWLGARLAARASAIAAGLWAPRPRRHELAAAARCHEHEVVVGGPTGEGAVARYCACGCGRTLVVDRRARYATDACRVRAFRARRGPQRDLMELLEADSGGKGSPVASGGR